MRDAIRTRHYSRRTEEAYVHWIRRYIVFHRKTHPSEMGATEISQFLTSLAVDRHVSASTQNQALSALLFLYKRVLAVQIGSVPPVVRARTPEQLPVVLSRDEVGAILKHFDRHQITVRQGKGRKDRVTMLPAAAREPLTGHFGRRGGFLLESFSILRTGATNEERARLRLRAASRSIR